MKKEDAVKKWVSCWNRADRALRKIKMQELRKYDYQRNSHLIDEMLEWACSHSQRRKGSGLILQQRIFMKLKKRQG